MPEMHAHKPESRLTLKSQLSDLALVWPWVEALALEHAIPANTQYAINLCLEEALSNVIRHGYAGEPNHAITVDCTRTGENGLTFIVEDSAPHFEPADSDPGTAPDFTAVTPASIEDITPGGHGITLMRHFAGTLAWEPLPKGNRLKLGFQIAQPAPFAS
jgi:anti-sigma regulatory factor (Ser/Thr protein kinase)